MCAPGGAALVSRLGAMGVTWCGELLVLESSATCLDDEDL
jgi:hypothetical protein